METYKVLSAATCSIELMGREVGYMQSLDIATNYNLQKIRNLWDTNYQGFVRGYSDYVITARKAFIEADSMFGTIDSLSNLYNGIKQLTKGNMGLSELVQTLGQIAVSTINLIGNLPPGLMSIEDLKQSQETITDVRNGAATIGDFFTTTQFDLKVKTSTVLSDILPATIVEGKKDIWVLSGCKLNTRNITLDMNNVIIMENITIYARKFTEPMFGSFNQDKSRLV
jgi:hypothetical protein